MENKLNRIGVLETYFNESCEMRQDLKDIVMLGLSLIKLTNESDEVIAKITDEEYETFKEIKDEIKRFNA